MLPLHHSHVSAPARIRTPDHLVRGQALYPLSYGGEAIQMGLEPTTTPWTGERASHCATGP